MKTHRLFFLLLIFPLLIAKTQAQPEGVLFTCGTKTVNSSSAFEVPIGQATMDVVVVFIDFPDGRIQPGNIVPTEDAQLNQVANLDAVVNMGYVTNDEGQTYTAKARKYTYADCWNRFFSVNTYIESAHPDWQSHGRFGYPPGGNITNYCSDTARAFGSLKDYYLEVSYGNLTLNPYLTHFNETGIYRTGIVNNIVNDGYGNRYIEPIMLPLNKRNGYIPPDPTPDQEADAMDEMVRNAEQKLKDMYPAQIEFNINTYTGEIIYVMAGGSAIIGGVAHYGYHRCLVREKRTANDCPEKKLCVIHGINIAVHEFGHLLGWIHTDYGGYCIMNASGTENTNCPPHVNMVYKLQAGWISNDRIRFVRTPQDVLNLPPSELNGDCAVITIYGKPGFDNYWKHSEFFVFENRRMFRNWSVKFDKKLVWYKNLSTPGNFNGGCLAFHYNNFNYTNGLNISSAFMKIINADPNRPSDLITDPGNAKDFFGVAVDKNIPPTVYTSLQDPRTKSSFDLTTGINFTNVSDGGNNLIGFHVDYSLGSPPDYNMVLYGQSGLPNPLNLLGSVFINKGGNSTVSGTQVNIYPGTYIDSYKQRFALNFGSNLLAEGTSENPVTFRGCGYGEFRTNFEELAVLNRPSEAGGETKIKFCRFENLPQWKGIIITTSTASENMPIVIEDNILEPNGNIQIMGGPANGTIRSIKRNAANVLLQPGPLKHILITEGIHIPYGKLIQLIPATYQWPSKFLFSQDAGIIVDYGYIEALGDANSRILLDKDSAASTWNGITVNHGNTNIVYCDIKNSLYGISLEYPMAENYIDNCKFELNRMWDFYTHGSYFIFWSPVYVRNNLFKGNPYKTCALGCNETEFTTVEGNTFQNDYTIGINALFAYAFVVKDNNMWATLEQGYAPLGIQMFSSGGNIECNTVTKYSKGILLDSSSPYLLNNYIFNNGTGLYLRNGSNPILSPFYGEGNILMSAGYNRIHSNLNSEIYCYNDDLFPLSLPILYNGNNDIHDDIHTPGDVLITTNYYGRPILAQNNYWAGDPASRFYPDGSVSYIPHLTEEPPVATCDEQTRMDLEKVKKGQTNNLVPSVFKLHQNYPNPFNPVAIIKYDLPEDVLVTIKVYDLLGREVITLVNEFKEAGYYEAVFDGTNYANGVYFYRIEAGTFVNTKKMVLVK